MDAVQQALRRGRPTDARHQVRADRRGWHTERRRREPVLPEPRAQERDDARVQQGRRLSAVAPGTLEAG